MVEKPPRFVQVELQVRGFDLQQLVLRAQSGQRKGGSVLETSTRWNCDGSQ